MDESIDKLFKIVNNKKNKNKKIVHVKNINYKQERKPGNSTKNKLMSFFNIDDQYTQKKFRSKNDTFNDNTYPVEDYNFSADLLFLPPYNGYYYLLVVVDNWSNEIEFEQIKNKEPETVLKAFKKIISRPFLNLPKASIRLDGGTEFKGVFKQYCEDNNILMRIGIASRHQQNSKAESAIRLISFIIINYLNVKEIEKQKNYRNWIELLPSLRIQLNKLRKRKNEDPFTKIYNSPIFQINKFKVDDIVVHILSHPVDALNKKQSTEGMRVGDYQYSLHNPKKIKKILYYSNNIRYVLEGLKNVSFKESELLPYRKINTDVKNVK